MRDGARDRALLQTEASHETVSDVVAGEVSLHDRDLEDVTFDIGHDESVFDPGALDRGLRDYLVGDQVDDPDALPLGRDVEVRGSQPLDIDGASKGQLRRGEGAHDHLPVARHDAPALEDGPDVEPLEAVDYHQVGDVAWSNRSEIFETEVLRRVDGRHSYRRDRVESLFDGHLDHVVDVSLFQQIFRMTVVGNEEAPRQVVARDHGQKVQQVLRHGTLADHDVHSQPELLEHLVD